MKAPARVLRNACVKETGVDEKLVNLSRNGNLEDSPEFRCYIRCIFEHAGMMDEDGTIHFNEIMHLLSPSMAETAKYVMQECKTIREHF